MSEDLVEIGRVKSANASRRAIKIALLREVNLQSLTWLHVCLRDGETLRLKVAAASGGDEPTVEFVAGVPRDLVGRMEKGIVLLPAQELPPSLEAGLDLDALPGMAALAEGVFLGTVVEVQHGPAHGWMTVETAAGARWIVAAVPPAVQAVDTEKLRVCLTPEWQHFAVDETQEASDAD